MSESSTNFCSKSKALLLDDLSGAVSVHVQTPFITFFVETRDGKACMSPVVFDTKDMEITNPKTWPRKLGQLQRQ